MSECKKLDCGHCESLLVDDYCRRPEHRFCLFCAEIEESNETDKMLEDSWKKVSDLEAQIERLTKDRDGYRLANESLCKALNAHHDEGNCLCRSLGVMPQGLEKKEVGGNPWAPNQDYPGKPCKIKAKDMKPDRLYRMQDGEIVVYSRIGGTGLVIVHPPEDPDMQSSSALDPDYLVEEVRES